MKLFKEIISSYQDFSRLAQKAIGNPDTMHQKNNFDIGKYLQIFHSFDTYCYVVADSSTFKIVETGGALTQLLGYQYEEFNGKSYQILFKLHKIVDIIKAARGGTTYFKYLYNQKAENRPFIKVNRTVDMKRKDGKWVHVLVQSIPILFNQDMEVIYFLNIITDIESMKSDRSYSHFIIDSSDAENIKKIPIHHNQEMQIDLSEVSTAEKRVLVLMAEGFSSKQIADQLSISEHTVKNHRKNMLQKTASTSSAALVKKALLEGWI